MAARRIKHKKQKTLMEYVETGDVAGVRKCVEAGVDLLDEMEDLSPLAVAVEAGRVDMVRALLDLGHDPDLGGIVVPLAEAARQGDEGLVELLLKRGATVDAPGEEGETALMWAAGADHLAVVKRLIEAGADIRQEDRERQDALEYAVSSRSTEVIEFLLPRCPDERQDRIRRQAHLQRDAGREKVSPMVALLEEAMNRPEPKTKRRASESLIHAFENAKDEQFFRLLEAGADPNETSKEGTTILGMVAGSSRAVDLLEPLVKAGADPNRGELFWPLNNAAGKGPEIVRLLLDAGADVNWADPDGDTPLMSAASWGDVEVIQMLLDAGADPTAENWEGRTAYGEAFLHGESQAADLLRPLTPAAADDERPWRKNKENKSLEMRLLDATRGGDIEYVERFLADGVPVDAGNESGETPLHLAADNDDVDLVDLLLEAGASVEAVNTGEWTPLVTAANSGCTRATRRLLEAGADVHVKNDTILCYTCENKDCLELVDALLEAGAPVNVVGGFRNATPLHSATEMDQPEVVRRLIEAGADLHVRDGSGWTPFLNAALRSGVETVQILIEAGSDTAAVDNEGRDALTLAKSWGNPEVAAFLLSLGIYG